MSIHPSVCPQEGGIQARSGWGVPHLAGEGGQYPSQVQLGGRRYPHPALPIQLWKGGTPIKPWMGVTHVWSVGTPSSLGQGYPHHWMEEGVPPPGWGYPLPKAGWGYSRPRLGEVRTGGVSEMEYPQPRAGLGYHPLPQARTANGVLDTPRSVCLLRSRRRTFLLTQVFATH